MAEGINMPRLSDTMEEGTLAKWFKKVGDSVKEGEILAEIETDKATMEFESFHDGVLLHIGIDEGSTAPVDSIIAVIGSKGEDISSIIKGVNGGGAKACCGGGAKACCGGGTKACCGGGAKASCGGGVKASCGGGAKASCGGGVKARYKASIPEQ